MATRREFLTTCIVTSVPVGIFSYELLAQARPQQPQQLPIKPGQKDDESETPKFDSKVMLESNKKDIKKDIEKLFQLASDLKAEVEKTDSVQVLSMAMLKKTEEIEKLAKEIRSRAIG
jgi:ribosomal protein L23